MKKLLLLTIAIITLNSCSSDSDEFQPNLSFNLENDIAIASSDIKATNTTTNENGGYIWEVISSSEIKTFTTKDLNFSANRVGEYTIRLKSKQFDIQTEQTINIIRPSLLKLNNITLDDVPQSYNSLYFKILKTSNYTYTYTSQTQQNISSVFPSTTDWNVSYPGNTIVITDKPSNFSGYIIEFYDGNDNLVTQIEPFIDLYPDFSSTEFIAEEKELTTSTNCTNCDYFKIIADISFQ
ncbi:hypothetical protein R3X25_14275 [Lutibacter sp. TH_r2]|uniref:hypothetical protein n=1 Tax=Lutibacter sp. TH_r2 TaxID=3082083 RepID=UPI0029555D96|nr:hypothetical protein [Lutibacter sp. TH_r2]MDV7188455.1 hypothetical protein [Lutibacter sp. TH_r2]